MTQAIGVRTCLMPRLIAMILATLSAPCGVVSAFIIMSSPNLSLGVLGFKGIEVLHMPYIAVTMKTPLVSPRTGFSLLYSS